MRLVDTHCHIDLDTFDDDRDAVIARAGADSVTDLLVIGFEPERWEAALQLAGKHRGIWVTAGLHPNSADRFDRLMLDSITEQTSRPEVVAIGETGVDLYWDAVPLETQRAAFRAQIGLARDLELPFIVHQRDAEQEVLEVLEEFPTPLSGVMHCFTGDGAYAKRVLDLGMHIGLGGAVTFKSRTELHEAVRQIPDDRLILETDSPYMAPTPHRGKRNEPAYVRLVAARVAELRVQQVEDVATVTTNNALELFGKMHNSACRRS